MIILPILFAMGVPRVLAVASFIMSIGSAMVVNAVYYNQLSTMIKGYPIDSHFFQFAFTALQSTKFFSLLCCYRP
jgi:hypothetical protein